jgi:6-phosphogluconolactonase
MSSPMERPSSHVVLVQSNGRDQNQLLSFRRDAAGALSGMDPVDAGGAGNGEPHLPSQGSVTLAGDARHAFVTNAGSGDLSLFTISAERPILAQTVPTGDAPLSVAEHDGLVYVLNSADASLTGLVMEGSRLSPVAGSMPRWDPDGKPAQVGLSSRRRSGLSRAGPRSPPTPSRTPR